MWFGFLNDHSGLGLQTLPITKPRQLVLPFLEISSPMYMALELHKDVFSQLRTRTVCEEVLGPR